MQFSNKNGYPEFHATRKELTDLLGVDVVPKTLANIWNSLIVWKQIDSPFLMPWDSIRRTEFMTRSTQQGKEERVYHGDQANLSPNDKRINTGYYEITSGIGSQKSISLELGMNASGIIGVPEAVGVVSPGAFFPMKEGVRNYEALRVWVDYADQKAMKVSVSLKDYLRVGNPTTTTQMTATLRAIGEVMQDIREDRKPDFMALREKLITEVGLEDLPEINWRERYPSGCMDKPMADHAAALRM
ncbi:MAG: hypothetical protein AAGB32_05205 [Pseudomonadota bacterium]